MAKAQPTRTIGPLHFEDLEPHRFEDLVRQLVYDFRPWRQLEATGRGGSDDGFDARGFEITNSTETGEADADDGEDEATLPSNTDDRVWLIQCKREKRIGPAQLEKYLSQVPAESLHGLIFAAPCDFSKTARDLFRAKIRSLGTAEAHLWGKGELEDILFQPKNDNLLFAYFGVSLRIRKRSLATEVRSRLAVKRKALKTLERHSGGILVRDASDDRYPYLDPNEKLGRFDRGRWYVYEFQDCRNDGIYLLFRRYMAFVDDDGLAWDYAEKMNTAIPMINPWETDEDASKKLKRQTGRDEADPIWSALPENNRGWYEEYLILPYESVIAIDEDGDDWFEQPHIYTVPFSEERGPFRSYRRLNLRTIGNRFISRSADPIPENRIKKFPREKK